MSRQRRTQLLLLQLMQRTLFLYAMAVFAVMKLVSVRERQVPTYVDKKQECIAQPRHITGI